MKRAALMLLSALALAACAPALTQPDNDPATLTLLTTAGAATLLTFFAGNADAYLKLTLKGNDLRVNAAKYCVPERSGIVCTVPRVPAGGNFVLPVTGSNIDAVAECKRLNGAMFRREAKQ